VDEHEVVDRDRRDQARVDVLLAIGGTYQRLVVLRADDLRYLALVRAGDANLALTDRSGVGEQAAMLEADMGELSQQVVEEDEPAVVGNGVGVVLQPEHVVGRPGRRARPGADPHGRHTPGVRTPHEVDDV